MQYAITTLALAAATFSGVFAAPTPYIVDVPVTFNGVTTVVSECVDSDLTCIRKRDILSPLSGTVTNAAGVIVGVTSESLSPVVATTAAGVAIRSIPVSDLVGTVSKLNSTVNASLTAIKDAVVTAVVDELAPTIISNLADIVVAINSTVNTTLSILPPTIDTVAALAIEEAESLISVLSEIQTIVDDIEAVIVPLLAEVAADVLALITPEVSAVLAAIMPLVTPITNFALAVSETVTDPEGEGNAIRTAAFEVVAAAENLVSPVTGALSSIVS